MTSLLPVAYRVAVVVALVWLLSGRPARASEEALEETPGVLRTSPSCDDIVGYSGPNDCEIRLDDAGRIASVRLLRSGDTVEHADAVRGDPEFLARFAGLSASDLAALAAIDGVSRATLTSLAVVEAVVKRLSGQRPSLRFPDAARVDEVRRWLPGAARLAENGPLRGVFDVHGERIGSAVRTGPLTEAVVGYQGPSDVLLVFDAGRRLRGMALRRSYDNPKYVDYVKDDAVFAEQFVGKTLAELAARLDAGPLQETIDGVSGATMTSVAVGEAVMRAARRCLAPPAAPARGMRVDGRAAGTLVAVFLALLLTFSRLRGRRWLRVVTRAGIVLWLGLLAGDMLSQGLLVGWVENGAPWRAAPGLVALAAVAFLVPVATGRQTYCHQLCAHGALQELCRRAPWRRPVPRALSRVLRWLPGATLVVVAVALALGLEGFPYAGIEPFGAWALPLAGVATCAVAAGGLLLSTVYPMAYCRLGCPTGALLDFVRRRPRAGWRRADAVAAGVLFVVLIGRIG